MKKHKTKPQTKRSRRRLVIAVAIVGVIVAAAVIAVASRRRGAETNSKLTDASAEKKYVTVKVAGREVQVDPQTGQIKPLSPEEAKNLADGLKNMFNRSTEGLNQVRHADGSLSIDLQGRFQSVAVARINADGAVEQSCVDTPQAAANFFGIDPQLLGVAPPKNAPTGAVGRTPVNRVSQ